MFYLTLYLPVTLIGALSVPKAKHRGHQLVSCVYDKALRLLEAKLKGCHDCIALYSEKMSGFKIIIAYKRYARRF